VLCRTLEWGLGLIHRQKFGFIATGNVTKLNSTTTLQEANIQELHFTSVSLMENSATYSVGLSQFPRNKLARKIRIRQHALIKTAFKHTNELAATYLRSHFTHSRAHLRNLRAKSEPAHLGLKKTQRWRN
jgi:hypothetical protein